MYEPPDDTETSQLPAGLVGDPCDSVAWLDEVPCQCLIDTGSQVTIISESFYTEFLSHREMLPINKPLNIEGAAGQRVPYVGYVEVEIQFPKYACGTDKCFPILALISPDQSYNEQFSLLVGTNVLCPMIQECRKRGGAKFLERLTIQTNWAMAYTECRRQNDLHANEAKVLRVTLSSKTPIRLKRGEISTLKGICHTNPKGQEYQAVVGRSDITSTPGGLIVYDQIVDVKPESHNKIKLAVKNISQHDITLYPKRVIAECSPIDWAVPITPHPHCQRREGASDDAAMFIL